MAILQSGPKWVLTFSDEFDGPAGTAPASDKWGRDVGGGGFGNNELESYTEGNKNSFMDGKGNLVIEARKESTTGKDGIHRDYSSARLLTKGKFTQTYGRFEAKIKIPKGQGIWPAFWMLGANAGGVGWPECGEIDILESVGPVAKTAYGTLHGPGYSGGDSIGGKIETPKSLADDFHVYAVEWAPDQIRWFLDDKCYNTLTPKDIRGNKWVFDHPFFLIMNLAVGGGWPGNPDATTVFPQRMVVDYVRVYKQEK
ncbi:MAG TPA: glycoside hydrolase family 16 protein [Fimbriimonas sp.]|nr:glycoside hydrolase family 16 protein [Fimbriimonas sp.]